METGEMIKKLRLAHNLTQEQLGEKLGVQKSAIAKYENGRVENLKRSTIQKMSELFGVSPLTFLGMKDNTLQELKIEYNDYFPLRYSTNLSAGTLEELLEAEPDAIVYVPIKYQMMKNRLNAFKVNGTSMNNVIQDGSIVIAEDISHLDKIKDGTIVVAWVEGCATVKRIFVKDHQVVLMPDSSDKSHLPITINTDIEPVSVIGRVIWHMNPDDIEKMY